jgi:putative oxidoreductase
MQLRTMGRWEAVAFTALRVMASLVLMQHGLQKLFGWFGGIPGSPTGRVQLFSLFGLAGVIETFIAALVLLGLFTRPAAFLISGEMAAAFFMVHLPQSFFPILNRGETPVLMCFIMFYFAAVGGGPYSLDARLRERGSSPVTAP